MKKLILIILVIGVFLTACGGGGQTAELPPEEGAKPAEVSVPTSVAEATPVPTAAPTATPVPTPTPIPEPKPSPEYGSPPIIDLTVVYPDGASITIPIYCPTPEEFCDSAVEVYDADGNHFGLGFSLPEGTPIFAVGNAKLLSSNIGGAYLSKGKWVYGFAFSLYGRDDTDPNYVPDWAKALPQTRFAYHYDGFGTIFPNPKVTDGEPPETSVSIRVSGGQELGRVIDPDSSVGWPRPPEGPNIYSRINFVLAAMGDLAYPPNTTFQIRIN